MRANRCSPPGEKKRVSHFKLCLFDAVQAAHLPQITYNHPATPTTTQQKISIYKILPFRFHVISDTSAFFSSLLLPILLSLAWALAPLLPPPPPPDFPVSSPSPCVLLCFGEISAGNCESFTSCSHNGLWDYAKHSASAALPIDRRQRRPLEHTGKRWRALNEDVTAITQARFTDTLSVCSSFSSIPLPHF